MPSLYVQDTWTVEQPSDAEPRRAHRDGNDSVVPDRTSRKPRSTFGFGDKIAPRLGATYDVRGDGKMKVFGSWGRYFDWVKYELARGSFGGDVWNIYYRSLDTLDVYNLSLATCPAANLWDPSDAGAYRDRRVPNFNTIDPNLKPMSQDATNVGIEYQLNPTTVFGANYVHNNLTRTIEDVGSLDANGNEVYFAAIRRRHRDDDVRRPG